MTDERMEQELWWAAGFWDGEGCARTSNSHLMRLQITQVDTQVLKRFKAAVGAGNITGPYGPYPSSPTSRPWYQWRAESRPAVQQVIDKLFDKVSEIKREQFLTTIANTGIQLEFAH